MLAKYAQLISSRVVKLAFDGTNTIDDDVKYMNIVVYPMIAAAMWKGSTSIQLPAARFTDKIFAMLKADGYVVKSLEGVQLTVKWGNQKIPNDDGTVRIVSSAEYNQYLDYIDAEFDARLGGDRDTLPFFDGPVD